MSPITLRVTESDARGETTLDTPFGTVHVRDNARLDPKHMGVPVYPGAVRDDNSRKLASFHFDFGDVHKAFRRFDGDLSHQRFRRSGHRLLSHRLPHWIISQRDNGGLQLSLTRHGYKRMVAIYEEDGETRIALASMGEPASN